MPATLTLASAEVRRDLATFLGRAGRIEDAGLRLQEVSGGIACWVPVLRPAGILTNSPLVIGVRGIPARIESTEAEDHVGDRVDIVVPLRGMLDRLAREPESEAEARRMLLPTERLRESWTGVTPPLAGWQRTATLSNDILIAVAEEGIAEVGQRADGIGQILAEQVRATTWTRTLPELARVKDAQANLAQDNLAQDNLAQDADSQDAHALDTYTQTPALLPPAGAAFAALALGFLKSGRTGQLSEAPGWWRLAFPAGQVLIRRR
ncbi:hypothetical protein [Gulosibacter molinativorax]|uniref:Uncharacterized protein n=1 Tax=Gulosibacter molinativorax TaxID=256821 RepID=A0ABT7C9A9_9MICO|nr:hypothetical protein [Gulosibacter molinativorax]MDJ1371801.1 hypothetical protein [Gulosibacter molinativorax]QUY60827.1 Hypotetical protein [Gulosibacter molinativorax]